METWVRERVAQTTEGASNTLNVKESGLGLGVSYNLWELIYVSYGVQRTTTTDGDVFLTVNSSSTNYRYLGNSWLDKFYGPQISPHRKENSYSDIWKNKFQSINKKLKQILKQSDIKVIIWMEENSRSNPLLLCYLATLSDCKNVYLSH